MDGLGYESDPCKNGCHMRYQCMHQELTCRQFAQWFEIGRIKPELPRDPTHKRWLKHSANDRPAAKPERETLPAWS